MDDVKIAHILKLRVYQPQREEISAIFEEPDLPENQKKPDTSHELMAYFLDGLIYHLRGKSDKHPPRPIKTPVTNNMVLKKLRVAFKLQEDDMHDIMDLAGSLKHLESNKCMMDNEDDEKAFKRAEVIARKIFLAPSN